MEHPLHPPGCKVAVRVCGLVLRCLAELVIWSAQGGVQVRYFFTSNDPLKDHSTLPILAAKANLCLLCYSHVTVRDHMTILGSRANFARVNTVHAQNVYKALLE